MASNRYTKPPSNEYKEHDFDDILPNMGSGFSLFSSSRWH